MVKSIIIFSAPVVIPWIASLFGEFGVIIRGWGRDHQIAVGYGELCGTWHPVPEKWFDYYFISGYPEGDSPTLAQHIFGYIPYPTFGHDGFGIPFWTLLTIIIPFCFTTFHLRKQSAL